MNDMPTPGRLTPEEQAELRNAVRSRSLMRESGTISKIAASLVRAQAMLENPLRNRTVDVRTQAGSYKFRYATLDKIIDSTRKALAENGLCILQPIVTTERGPAVLTRILHESGEWMEVETGLPSIGSDPQKFGSAVTYIRRYALSALLNIAADEDDDANRAAGNHYQDSPRGQRNQDRRRQERERGDDLNELVGDAVARALVNRARLAEGVEEGHALLEAWIQRAAVLEGLRGTTAWETLEREMAAGVRRSLGVEPAAAFIAAMRATEAAHIVALQGHWEGKWAQTLGAMQQEAPATYAMLRRHVAAQIARVRAASGEEQAAPPAAVPFNAVLKDADGTATTDPMTSEVAFAEAYAAELKGTEPEARGALQRNNAKALGLAVKHPEARKILESLIEQSPKAEGDTMKEVADGVQRRQAGEPDPGPQAPNTPTTIRLFGAADEEWNVQATARSPVHIRWLGGWKKEVSRLANAGHAERWLKKHEDDAEALPRVAKHWPDVEEAARMEYANRLKTLKDGFPGEQPDGPDIGR